MIVEKEVAWICPACGGKGPWKEGAMRMEATPEFARVMKDCKCGKKAN